LEAAVYFAKNTQCKTNQTNKDILGYFALLFEVENMNHEGST